MTMVQHPAIWGAFETIPALPDNLPEMLPEQIIDLFRELFTRRGVDLGSPYNFGLYALSPEHNPGPDSSAAGMARQIKAEMASNVGVPGQHPVEEKLQHESINRLLSMFGYDPATSEGHYTSGGTESNLTAMRVALGQYKAEAGRKPVIYISAATHASVSKNIRTIFWDGNAELRVIPCDACGAMDINALRKAVRQDAASEHVKPFFMVGTFGTTSTGMIDPLKEMADICNRHHIWFHIDAAWGGKFLVLPEYAELKTVFSKAGSITFDPHKSFVSLASGGVGAFLTNHCGLPGQVFSGKKVKASPSNLAQRSMAGSRPFVGLEVMTAMADPGLAHGYRREMALGRVLREGLSKKGWLVTNDTDLPVVCARYPGMDSHAVNDELKKRGILAFVNEATHSLRLGIISRSTRERHVMELIGILHSMTASSAPAFKGLGL